MEAGLRSFDRSMPEEINRLLTDQVCEVLFTPSSEADQNLEREGITRDKIHRVGNVMIDTLLRLLPESDRHVPADLPERYALVTLHRPSNVDDPAFLRRLLVTFADLSKTIPVLFAVHPRTRQRIASLDADIASNGKLRFLDPLPYLSCLALLRRATLVITDSGGIQEETTFLKIPCLTVRETRNVPLQFP